MNTVMSTVMYAQSQDHVSSQDTVVKFDRSESLSYYKIQKSLDSKNVTIGTGV